MTELNCPEPKIRVAPVISLAKYFEVHDLDFKSLARACDFPVHKLKDPMSSVPLRVMADVFVRATTITGDYGLPIKLAEDAVVGSSGLLGHLAMSAPTVRAFMECLAGYMPILVTGCDVGFEESGGTGRLFWHTPIDLDVPTKPLGLYLAASIVYRIRVAAGESWVPLAVSFEHNAPKVTPRELSVFGSRIAFDDGETSMTVDTATLSKPLPTANDELFAIFKHHAALLMREVSAEQDLPTQVRNAIGLRLMLETPTLEMIAQDVRIPPRALQRRLDRIGMSFEKVLDETRCMIAERLLRETDRPIIQVAYEVGYGSQSTFTRAVRRWLDESPRAYRQRFRGFQLGPRGGRIPSHRSVSAASSE